MTGLRDYFNFNRGERRGLVVLYTIIVALIVYVFFSKQFVSEDPLTQEEIESLELDYDTSYVSVPAQDSLFEFNPNTLDVEGWVALGLTEKQAGSIRKYIDKGGKLRKVEDLRKLYAVDDEFYEKIAPYAVFEKTAGYNHPKKESNTYVQIDLNTDDESRFRLIKGIGKSKAASIVKYRNSLGGFVSKDQLFEIYVLDSSVASDLHSKAVISGDVKRIDVNNFEPKELWSHPYVRDWDLVNQIRNERDNFGDYQSVQDLFDRLNLDEPLISKLRPYLKTDGGDTE